MVSNTYGISIIRKKLIQIQESAQKLSLLKIISLKIVYVESVYKVLCICYFRQSRLVGQAYGPVPLAMTVVDEI